MDNIRVPKAFISCSLREEDQPFNAFIINLARHFGLEPCCTVGLFRAAPKAILNQMESGIEEADCLIMIATPRYLQEDISNKDKQDEAISESLLVEFVLSYKEQKPILIFALEGVKLPDIILNQVQVIYLKHKDPELHLKWKLISSYFESAHKMIVRNWNRNLARGALEFTTAFLAGIGIATIADFLASVFKNRQE